MKTKITRINIRLSGFIMILWYCSINGAIITLCDFVKNYW